MGVGVGVKMEDRERKAGEKEKDLVINYFIHIQLCRCMLDW